MGTCCCPRGVGCVCGRSRVRTANAVEVATNRKGTRAELARLGSLSGDGSVHHRDANPQNAGQSEGQGCRVNRFLSVTSVAQRLVGAARDPKGGLGFSTGGTCVPASTANAAAPTPDGREWGYSVPLSFMR